MKKLLITLIISIVIMFSCNKSSTEPNDGPIGPAGSQTDILWPSLADSPWPMERCDPQNTGRSKYLGPVSGTIYKKLKGYDIENSVIVGKDSTIYYNSEKYLIISQKYIGDTNWTKNVLLSPSTTPLQRDDGAIILSGYNRILAYDKAGILKWEYILPSGENVTNKTISVGIDGNLYFIGQNNTLYSLNRDGNLQWSYTDARFVVGSEVSLSFSPDGKTIYIQGHNSTFFAFDILSKSIKWIFSIAGSYSANPLVVDCNGNIIFLPAMYTGNKNIIYFIDKDGNEKWHYEFPGGYLIQGITPTIDNNGNIYFGYDSLYSLNYSGGLNWSKSLGEWRIGSSLISDNTGNIYFSTFHKTDLKQKIFSIKKDSNINWEISLEGDNRMGSSPSISEDRTLYFPFWRSKDILIIK